MARKKIVKYGFYIKYIPTGRLTKLEELAKAFPFIENKTLALYKYVELFSSIVERTWNTCLYHKEFKRTLLGWIILLQKESWTI